MPHQNSFIIHIYLCFTLLLLFSFGGIDGGTMGNTYEQQADGTETEPNAVDFVLLMSGVVLNDIDAGPDEEKESTRILSRARRCADGYDLETSCKWVLFDDDEDAPWIYRDCTFWCVSSFAGVAFVAVGAVALVVVNKVRHQKKNKRVTFLETADDDGVYKEMVERCAVDV